MFPSTLAEMITYSERNVVGETVIKMQEENFPQAMITLRGLQAALTALVSLIVYENRNI